jgi:hypothetical protein
MKHPLQAKRIYRDAGGDIHTLEYTMTQEQHHSRVGYALTLRADGGQSVHIPDLTSSPERARQMFNLLVRGCVTPTTLLEILDDLLA